MQEPRKNKPKGHVLKKKRSKGWEKAIFSN